MEGGTNSNQREGFCLCAWCCKWRPQSRRSILQFVALHRPTLIGHTLRELTSRIHDHSIARTCLIGLHDDDVLHTPPEVGVPKRPIESREPPLRQPEV